MKKGSADALVKSSIRILYNITEVLVIKDNFLSAWSTRILETYIILLSHEIKKASKINETLCWYF